MKLILKCTMMAILLTMSGIVLAQQPEIVDREIFFGDPEIAGGQLSPDGKYISFLKPYRGTRNIWVKGIDQEFDQARPITADTSRPISGYFWSRNGQYILYVQDKGGDENYHVYAVNPSSTATNALGVPDARNITDYEGARAIIFRVPRSKPGIIYVGLNDRDASYHDLYEVDIETGKRTLIYENTDKISGFNFDNDDVLRMASRTSEDGSTEILNITDEGFEPLYTCSVIETAYISGFEKNNKRAYLVTNKGDDVNLTRLMLIDPKNGRTALVESDPENQVDFGGMIRSSISHEILATVYVGAKQRIYFKDKDFEADYNLLKERFDDATIGMSSSTEDEMMYLVSVTSDVDPGTVYLFDRKTKKTTMQYRPRPDIPIEAMSPMKPVTYKSFDGLEIPAYLTLPKGKESSDLPAVLLVHGGPWARDFWGFNGYAQFLANRGYAVLSMNFRGSTGFGKDFLNAGNGEWGRKMQDDVTAGARYLVEQGIADEDRIAIMGGSYGGYATLAGVTFTPDEYACGVSIVGPSNLMTLMESIPPYWESFRKVMYSRMADPETEEGAKWFEERSPLNYADKIEVPLLVVQGANDPRVKKAESDQIVVAMRELNLPVEYIVAPDEGHGFQRPVNQMAFIAATEKFLASHVGGRYQKDMTEEVENRLEEITVDINTVELPKELTQNDLMAKMPESNGKVTTGEFEISMNIEMGGQKMPMPMTRTVIEEEDAWMVNDVISSPMGEMSSKYKLDKKTLLPEKVDFKQGPASGELTFSGNKVEGSMSVNGSNTPISADLDAPVCADGGAMGIYLASLPLETGYSGTLRTFDIQSANVKHLNMIVADEEEVEVPAGKFNCYRIEVKPADSSPGSQTFWISMSDRVVVKQSAVVPEMGGAVMTSELSSRK